MDSAREPLSPGNAPCPAARRAAALASSFGIALIVTTLASCSREEPAQAASPLLIESSKAFSRSLTAPGNGAVPATGGEWTRLGQQYRVERRFAECASAFEQAVLAVPADADSWADLADCRAAASDHDLRVGRDAIHRALSIDPRHRKALWLRASLELQEEDFSTAAATWRELLELVRPESPDARILSANIAEADLLARSAGAVQPWPR